MFLSISFDMRSDQLEDIYNRQFTGDADVDPIGGRKRRPAGSIYIINCHDIYIYNIYKMWLEFYVSRKPINNILIYIYD